MLRDIRNSYEKYKLNEKELNSSPIALFEEWLDEAILKKVVEPTVMVLSTVSNGIPDSRVVLLKELTQEGFIFHTNYHSVKGEQLSKNPNVSLNFFWAEMERQVRVKGIASKLSAKQSKEYFESRPRDSQLGACASKQSQKVENREKLEEQFIHTEKTFEGKEITMPDHWGGYLVKPFEIEFWQGRANRMHDRISFYQDKKGWCFKRLQP